MYIFGEVEVLGNSKKMVKVERSTRRTVARIGRQQGADNIGDAYKLFQGARRVGFQTYRNYPNTGAGKRNRAANYIAGWMRERMWVKNYNRRRRFQGFRRYWRRRAGNP